MSSLEDSFSILDAMLFSNPSLGLAATRSILRNSVLIFPFAVLDFRIFRLPKVKFRVVYGRIKAAGENSTADLKSRLANLTC